MDNNSACPLEATLRALLAGQLEEPVRAHVREHVDRCAQFQEVVRGLEQQTPSVPTPGQKSTLEPGAAEAEPFDLDALGTPEEEKFDRALLAPSSNPDAMGRLGKYDVLEVIGTGGMGVVLRGFDEQLRRAVAIKVLNRRLASSPTARRRFLREARAAAGINHPNVVTIYAVEEHQHSPLLVMEYVGGGSLRDYLRAHDRLEPLEILRLSKEIASGLAAAHAYGVIHRDIKPGNILLEGGAGRVKISDFGVARAAVDNVDLTSRELAVGTPAYMSPEQVTGKPLDLRSDLFSLGCLIYAMVAKHSPFQGHHPLEIARKVVDYHPPPLEKTHEGTPKAISDTVARLLAKNPEDRFQSATEVAELLNRYLTVLHQTPTDKMSTVLRTGLVRDARKRSFWFWVLGPVAALLAISVGALWLVLRDGHEQAGAGPPSRPVATPGTAPAATPPRLIKVAQSGPADARTLGDAISRAGPGTVIRVTDQSRYVETLEFSDPQRLGNVCLEAVVTSGGTARATLAPPDADQLLVRIRDVSGLTVRGFRFEPANASGIIIDGAASGIVLDTIEVLQPEDEGNPPGVYIQAVRRSERDEPIVIRNSLLRNPPPGQCLLIVGTQQRAQLVRVENNLFSGDGVQVLLDAPAGTSLAEIVLAGNVFVGRAGPSVPNAIPTNGINLNLVDPRPELDVRIHNNTFWNVNHWIGIVFSETEHPGVLVANNLILGATRVEGVPDRVDTASRHWRFAANWWEPGPTTDADAGWGGRVAVLQPHIELLERRDPQHPNFLRPPPGSPLFTSGDKQGGLPEHIGARGPQPIAEQSLALPLK